MNPPTFGPLLPIVKEPSPDDAKAILTFGAIVIAARVFPRAIGPIAEYGLGVRVAGVTGLAELTPLGLTNVLPQPFGFVPSRHFGLAPNFYIPDGFGYNLPSFIPGADEQRAERQADIANRIASRSRLEIESFTSIANQRGTQVLQAQLDAFQRNRGQLGYYDEDAIINALQTILAAREQNRIENNAEAAARVAARLRAQSMATNPGDNQPPQQLGGNQGPAPLVGPPAPVVLPGGSGGTGQPQFGPPNGFVQIPNGDGNNIAVAPPPHLAAQGYYAEFDGFISGPFPDTFISRTHGDP